MNDLPAQSSPTIRGVALDMDGLLFDTEGLYWEVGDELLKRRGHRFCKGLQSRMMGRIGTAALQEMVDYFSLSDSAEQLLQESDVLFMQMLDQGIQSMPGLSHWIDFLGQLQLPFGIATSSRRKFVEVIFRDIPWSSSLSFTLTGDDVTRGKPDPQIYQMAAGRLGISTEEMLVLEDSGNGCAAAVASGAIAVAVPSPHTREHTFTGAALIAESLLDPRLWELVRHGSSLRGDR
jgi:HAD superfamily hydrolase (TIGR01509 family)